MMSWKIRLMMLLAVAAMLITVAGPVMAQDCEFIGFDGDDAVFECTVDLDFDGIDDNFDDFVDANFDGFDDRFFFGHFFFDDDIDDEDCIGVIAGDECIGVG